MAYALGQLFGLIIFAAIVMLVVGGIYYLIRRPRITFRQAIFRWWVVTIAIVLTLLGRIGQVAQNLAQ